MTSIQPQWSPRSEPKPVVVEKPSWGSGIVALAGASLLVVTTINVGATIYLSSAIAELRATEERLAKLPAFEARIMQRLELVNNGVQSQFDKLTRVDEGRHQALMKQLEAGRVQALVQLPTVSESRTYEAAQIEPPMIEEAPLPTVVPMPAAEVETQKPVARRVRQASTPSYERINGPDGKVTYRRVQ